MTGEQFKRRREALGLSQSQMAKRLPVAVKTLQGWESKFKDKALPSYLQRALRSLETELGHK